MSHKKLLQMIGMMLIIVSLGCGIPAIFPASEDPGATDMPEAPATADTPEALAATNTPKPPTSTPTPEPEPTDEEPDGILAVEMAEKPVNFGDVERLKNGEVRMWMGFGGTIKNIGNVPLTDLRVCVKLNYKTTTWKHDCGSKMDLAVGETRKYGAGFHLEGQPDDLKDGLAESSYVITVRSGDSEVKIKKAN
jgi:hypothetical protein